MNNKVILKIITSNDEDINIPFMRLQELDDYTVRFDNQESLVGKLISLLEIPIDTSQVRHVLVECTPTSRNGKPYKAKYLPIKYKKDNYDSNNLKKVFADYLIEDYDRIKEFDIRYISSKPIQDYLYGNGTLTPYNIYHAVESYFERDSYGKKRSAYFTLKKNKRKVYIRRVENIHLREKNPLLKATFDDEYLDNLARYARQGEEEYDYVMDIIAGSDIEDLERKTTDKHYGVVDSVYDSMKDDITKLELFTRRNIYELRDIANREIKRSGKNTR